MNSPAYIFDIDEFGKQVERIKVELGENIPLCFSIKANPFLLNSIPKGIERVEVCSPGELSLCEELNIDPQMIIYSGVMKEYEDIERAVNYDVAILTAESKLHVELENEVCMAKNKIKNVILRLTSGNQFGMSVSDIDEIICNRENYKGLNIIGIHYYSGTQKKLRQVDKDFKRLNELMDLLKDKYNYVPKLVEYGPGIPVNYFTYPYEDQDMEMLKEVAGRIKEFAQKYPVGIEMGRFLATSCGYYLTSVKDIKNNNETDYVICDGGIHHLKYYGQNMAMQIPPLYYIDGERNLPDAVLETIAKPKKNEDELVPYTLCGSLCTVADVLIREVNLPKLSIGDRLLFGRCGAYSVTEGTVLFLSRNMPEIYFYSDKWGLKKIRQEKASYLINMME